MAWAPDPVHSLEGPEPGPPIMKLGVSNGLLEYDVDIYEWWDDRVLRSFLADCHVPAYLYCERGTEDDPGRCHFLGSPAFKHREFSAVHGRSYSGWHAKNWQVTWGTCEQGRPRQVYNLTTKYIDDLSYQGVNGWFKHRNLTFVPNPHHLAEDKEEWICITPGYPIFLRKVRQPHLVQHPELSNDHSLP